MRSTLVFIMMAMISIATYAADVAGTWKGAMDTPMGSMENTITLAVDGTTLTGSIKTDFFDSKIENGKVDGDKISFVIAMDFGSLTYEGTVTGDELKLQITGPDGNKIPMTAKKQK